MLMIERQLRNTYAFMLNADTKMPRKGQKLYPSSPFVPSGMVIIWTDRKSPDGRRLFNVGAVTPDGKDPELFR